MNDNVGVAFLLGLGAGLGVWWFVGDQLGGGTTMARAIGLLMGAVAFWKVSEATYQPPPTRPRPPVEVMRPPVDDDALEGADDAVDEPAALAEEAQNANHALTEPLGNLNAQAELSDSSSWAIVFGFDGAATWVRHSIQACFEQVHGRDGLWIDDEPTVEDGLLQQYVRTPNLSSQDLQSFVDAARGIDGLVRVCSVSTDSWNLTEAEHPAGGKGRKRWRINLAGESGDVDTGHVQALCQKHAVPSESVSEYLTQWDDEPATVLFSVVTEPLPRNEALRLASMLLGSDGVSQAYGPLIEPADQ